MKLSSLKNLLLTKNNMFRNLSTSAPTLPYFDKILIANRGEIACRIQRTCKKLGIKTVAIYSTADSRSLHVRNADEAYCVGPPATKESYLNMNKIIEIAKKSGAKAIHPGFGFLSENSHFAELVEKNGIVFLGPESHAMDAMGDKIHSKAIALKAKCSVIPGFQGEVETAEKAISVAREIGYPVMVKASAGGGGKGIRVAYNDNELIEGFRLSKSEAISSFGDDRMLIEKFIEEPHHIEIQVIADSHGNVAAFPERECSVQRRNQKVVEEAPSCLIDKETRLKMQKEAIMLCKAVGYRSAGTIEMLCDKNKNFYFLEMNTRLQVEHAITELISGEDLVELMIHVGAGHKLPQRFLDNPHVPHHGWAIESRVYAEDPLRNFLPCIGPLNTYVAPEIQNSPDGTVRLDTGVFEGGVISMYYDPMIAKLCTYAPTRTTAISLMEKALDQYVIHGLNNNTSFLTAVMRNEKFRIGNYSTKFIREEFPNGFKGVKLTEKETFELICFSSVMHQARADMAKEMQADSMEGDMPNPDDDFVVVLGGPKGDAYHVSMFMTNTRDGDAMEVTIESMSDPSKKATLLVGDCNWRVGSPLAKMTLKDIDSVIPSDSELDEADSDDADDAEFGFEPLPEQYVQFEKRTAEGFLLRYKGSEQEVIFRTHAQQELFKHMLDKEKRDYSNVILCPMPGSLVSISVKPGDSILAGQEIAVIEAMKMQNVLRAPKDGVVKTVKSVPGNHLKVDQVIVEYA